MRLEKYPRPQNDTGIGFHYIPDAQHFGRDHLDFWLPQLRNLQTAWLIVRCDLGFRLPEFFLRELLSAGIEPVVLVPVRPIRPVDPLEVGDIAKTYASYGVHYLAFYDRPNLVSEWSPIEWAKPALVDRFLEMLVPCLERIADAGLFPVFPPLFPGGHYWDTSFLSTALQRIGTLEKSYLFDRLAIGIYNFAFNRPLSWGRGGSAKWRASKPYFTPQGTEDHRGFRLFEWYDEIVRSRIGYALPLIALGSGAVFGNQEDAAFSEVDEGVHAERNVEIVRQLLEGEVSASLCNQTFWVLASGGNPSLEPAAWFKSDGSRLAAVDRLRDLPKGPRKQPDAKAVENQPVRYAKPIHHYLLFATNERGILEEDWKAAQNYIRRFQPSCGFRLEEAMQAEYVTVVGSPLGVSLQDERTLRAAGCKVERLGGETPRSTKRALDELVSSGRRFLTY